MAKSVIFAPGNHQDLVMLFCLIQDQLKMIWLGACLSEKKGQRKPSPDGEVWDYSEEKVKTVEFEFLSSQYDHSEKYDYLICWTRDRDFPDMKIIELREFFPNVMDKESLRYTNDSRKAEVIKNLIQRTVWTEDKFRRLKLGQQKTLVYLLRKEDSVNSKQIAKDLGMTSHEVAASIGGFVQKTLAVNKYEEIIERDFGRNFRFAPKMRTKYGDLIEKVLGDKLP